MRRLYLFLIVAASIAIILFVATFFYIDTHRHRTFLYNIYKENKPLASVTLDKYNTEERIIYKSVTNTPFHSTNNIHKRTLSIDKRDFRFYSYNKKHLSEGVSMDVYIKRMDSAITFLAVGHSDFAYAKRLPVDRDSLIFEEDALISYFILIDKYDFKKGGLQHIPVLTHEYTFLPPYKSKIQMRFIDEGQVRLNGKNIKALRFIIKTADKKEILMWANRWTHLPLIIREPKSNFEAIWSDRLVDIPVKKYTIESDVYENREVAFKNKDITLSGTLSLPKGNGPFPAVILVWGPGPQDRDALGMFIDLANGFAQNKIAVLRFDKRGVGKSEGNFSRITGKDLIEDISSAVDFLNQQKMIDKKKIAVLGHSEGGYYAASLAAHNPNISACIIMGGVEAINLPDTDLEMMWTFNKSAMNWDKEYLNDIARTAMDTSEILKRNRDWAILLQKRVFLKKSYLDIEKKSLDMIRKLKVPTLILRGKKDTVILPEHIKLLKEALKEGGNKNYNIVYFNKLNHFFSEKIDDGIHRTHLSINNEVIDTVINWLNLNLISSSESGKGEPSIKKEGVIQEGPLKIEEELKEPETESDSNIEKVKEGVL